MKKYDTIALGYCIYCDGKLRIVTTTVQCCDHCRTEYKYEIFVDPHDPDQEKQSKYHASMAAGGIGQLLFLLEERALDGRVS